MTLVRPLPPTKRENGAISGGMFLLLFRSDPSVLWQKTQLYKKTAGLQGAKILRFSPLSGKAGNGGIEDQSSAIS